EKPQVATKTRGLVAFLLSAQTSQGVKNPKLPRKQGDLLLLRNSENNRLQEVMTVTSLTQKGGTIMMKS
ncbi:hypothetical protein, partial [Butyrivibrio sp. NC2002]|uniref:hypothetical protein n=1 Tax=Butyrivibrio sp. NC2002 TaxID=1410610 RepID=UPI00056C52BF